MSRDNPLWGAPHIHGELLKLGITIGETSVATYILATLRRTFHLAAEWGKVSTILPRVRLLAGENHRERVLSLEEERKYLDATTAIGHGLTKHTGGRSKVSGP
jgi:hypothetical protein